MASFFTIFFSVYGAVHLYLAFRLARLPWIQAHSAGKWVILALICLAASFPLARFLERPGYERIAHVLEVIGTYWMGTFFILFWVFLLVDIATLGGFAFREHVPFIRTLAACTGLLIAAFAAIQGNRAPVVTEYDVPMKGLPAELDNFRLVLISDLHLGSRIGPGWIHATFAQIDALKGDAIVIAGDLIDHDATQVAPMVNDLKQLHAPKGVYAVVGNHEYYAGDTESVAVLKAAGYRVLRNEHVQIAPGLIVAGVDDLSVARRRSIDPAPAFAQALNGRPAGATVLVTHSPHGAATASAAGVGLMVSGHTHNGQIWPFNYLVRTQFDTVYGAYQRGNTTAIVTRGAGTWGPRMRLWSPGEIVLIRLHPTE